MGEYAEDYLSKLAKLNEEIRSVAENLAQSPEDKKAAYQKFLGKLKGERIKLMEENGVTAPN